MIHRIDSQPRYSQAVVYNGTVYLSGQISLQGGDITAQCREVFGHVERQLQAAGSSKDRILNLQIFLVHPGHYEAMNVVYDEWLPAGTAPARNTICGVVFPNPNWLIEVVCCAAV